MVWLFVPALEASNSVSDSLFPDIEPSVTSKGKPIQLQSLSLAWKKESWIRRLSGMTLKPSMANNGVVSLILSLRASRASLGPRQDLRKEPMMNDGYGPRSPASLARWDPDTCSWRTFQVSLEGDLVMYSGPWPYAGSMRSGTCSQLPPREPPTSGNGCSSLLEKGMWPTPKAWDGLMGLPRTRGRPIEKVTHLTTAVRYWPTPTAHDSHHGGPGATSEGERHSPNLPWVVSQGNGGKLNPDWDEWLMGFPIGWTGLDPLEMGSFQLWLQGLLPNSVRDSDNMQGSESNG